VYTGDPTGLGCILLYKTDEETVKATKLNAKYRTLKDSIIMPRDKMTDGKKRNYTITEETT
jgi:hypothetical protein